MKIESHLKHIMEFSNGSQIQLYSENPEEKFEGCIFTIYVTEDGTVFAKMDRQEPA